MVVVTRNRGGAYIIAELDGSVFDRPIAAFRVIPYFARKNIQAPMELLDISTDELRELERSDEAGDGDEEEWLGPAEEDGQNPPSNGFQYDEERDDNIVRS
ncbi:hypothetical protein C8Q80DRAFT_1115980 [Daedaleopsis nitida]|nr:hypothetical protein C8Q80DRAFT_1117182 [Daedaleopsis nitida]KAI0756493.1 hypothetical protein C8Q80DRAFT_1115980 [Daedaleopsis nitida]